MKRWRWIQGISPVTGLSILGMVQVSGIQFGYAGSHLIWKVFNSNYQWAALNYTLRFWKPPAWLTTGECSRYGIGYWTLQRDFSIHRTRCLLIEEFRSSHHWRRLQHLKRMNLIQRTVRIMISRGKPGYVYLSLCWSPEMNSIPEDATTLENGRKTCALVVSRSIPNQSSIYLPCTFWSMTVHGKRFDDSRFLRDYAAQC